MAGDGALGRAGAVQAALAAGFPASGAPGALGSAGHEARAGLGESVHAAGAREAGARANGSREGGPAPGAAKQQHPGGGVCTLGPVGEAGGPGLRP